MATDAGKGSKPRPIEKIETFHSNWDRVFTQSTEGTVSQQDYRKIHAKADKQSGRRAYSDGFDHVIVRIYGTEHHFDLACAVRLREDLDKAIRNAALSDEDYINMCEMEFDDWYSEQCAIDAAEMVGPNSPEYDVLTERYYEDETRRDAAQQRYHMEKGAA